MDFNKIHIIPDVNHLEEYIELAKEYGLHFEYNDFFYPWILDDEERKNDCVEKYLDHKDLPEGNSLHGAFLDVTLFSYDEKIRKVSEFRIRQSLDVASRIGAKSVIIHTNYIPTFRDEAYENNWVEKNYQYFKRILKEYPDINVYMENMFDITPYMLERLAEKLKDYDNFGVCLDYAHVNVFGTGPVTPNIWMKRLAPYVKHVHINDNDLKTDGHLALGQGKIDYKEFINYYNELFPEATVLIEVNGLDKIKESIKYLQDNCLVK